MEYRAWKDSDIKTLERMANEDKPIQDICRKLGRTKLSVANQLKKIGSPVATQEAPEAPSLETPRSRRADLEKAAISFLDKVGSKDRDYTDVWSTIFNFQDALEQRNIEQKEVSIKITTNKWIGVAIVGDLHIGNMATNYKLMLKHRDLIAKTPDLYVMLNGDYVDNFLPTSHPDGMFEALLPPAVQKNMAIDYISKLKHKVLALITGDHEIFGVKASDFDLTEYLAKYSDAAYLGNGGIVYLTVGKQMYKLNIRHRYRLNSQENPTASVKKMFEKTGGFDVGVLSHNHIACIEEAVKEGMDGNKKRLFIRAGTYKQTDRYAKKLGFTESDIGVPVVLFNPETRQMRGFSDIEEGIEYLAYLNKK